MERLTLTSLTRNNPMKIALIILLILASAFVLALLIVGIIGVIICGQWTDFDELMNDEEEEKK